MRLRKGHARCRLGCQAAILAIVSLVWACAPLLSASQTGWNFEIQAPLPDNSLAFALVSISAVLVAVRRKVDWPRGRQIAAPILIGLSVFALPPILARMAYPAVSALDITAILTLVPLFSVLLEPHWVDCARVPARDADTGSNAGSDRLQVPRPRQPDTPSSPIHNGHMPASLAVVAGTLSFTAPALPATFRAGAGWAATVAAAASVAAGSCWAVAVFRQRATGSANSPQIALAAGSAAVALAIFSPIGDRGHGVAALLWPVLLVSSTLWLFFWLIGRMSAAQLSARFVLPLLAVLPVGILFGELLTLRVLVGLALLALGAARLLWPTQASQPNENRQRGGYSDRYLDL